MSKYYNPKKTRNLFDKNAKEPFVVSRSGIDLFLNCPKCFYIEKKLGTSRPPGFPFSLNNAVDTLLKKEFDSHRIDGIAHPLMEAYGVDAVPYPHEELEKWREARTAGIKFFHEPTNLIIRGGIDDIWINSSGELHIVDYKATSKNEEVNLDAEWQIGYKRQVEVYQWLFRQNGFKVSDIAYFVYCNGITDREAFDAKLEFDVKVIAYNGDDSWVNDVLKDLKKCLLFEKMPENGKDCDYCAYFEARESLDKEKSA